MLHRPLASVSPSIHHFQRSSSPKPLGQSKPNFMWSLHGSGEWKFVWGIWVTWTRWPSCPYMVKTLQKSSSLEPKGQWPWALVCIIRALGPSKFVQMMTLVWPWPILWQDQIWSLMLYMGKSVRKSFNGRNLQQMIRVTWGICLHKNYDPRGLSTPARGYIHV